MKLCEVRPSELRKFVFVEKGPYARITIDYGDTKFFNTENAKKYGYSRFSHHDLKTKDDAEFVVDLCKRRKWNYVISHYK